VIACPLTALTVAAPASAHPTLVVMGACGYSGAQFALGGSGFDSGERESVDVMSTADPLVGAPVSTREVTTSPAGRLYMLLDVPATDGTRPVARSVRVRSSPDPSLGMPTLLATAPVSTMTRGVTVLPQRPGGSAGRIERWSVTGMPEGTRLWAHYRHDARTVARVALGTADGHCGPLEFELRTLPSGRERPGAWDVWMTSERTLRLPPGACTSDGT
jgi:hypothetical protein